MAITSYANKESLTTATTVAATAVTAAVFVRAAAAELIPSRLQDSIANSVSNLFFNLFTSTTTVVVDESDGATTNHMYKAAQLYLVARLPSVAGAAARRLKVHKQEDEDVAVDVGLEEGAEVVDVFDGVKFKWRLVVHVQNLPRHYRNRHAYHHNQPPQELRCFELSFHKKHKDMVLKSYLPHVLQQSKLIKEASRTLKLFTNESDSWNAANFQHPGAFEKLAMDEGVKEKLIEDLQRFVNRKEYYKKIGKAWKRGYLLYGPPGTGKSTLIAAIANFLRFDVYDLMLSEVQSNAMLRSLIVGTSSRSILVVEDIDCSMKMQQSRGGSEEAQINAESEDKVTLSGLLNFVDGLWSSCGDEKIIIFTTNYKDRLDPALLRPGRMDMHIHMSYCSPSGFRILASTYHSIDNHPLFTEIDELLKIVDATPAEVAEELIKSEDSETALNELVCFLRSKMKGAY